MFCLWSTLSPQRKFWFTSRSFTSSWTRLFSRFCTKNCSSSFYFSLLCVAVPLFFVKSRSSSVASKFPLLFKWIILNWIISFDSLLFIRWLTNSLETCSPLALLKYHVWNQIFLTVLNLPEMSILTPKMSMVRQALSFLFANSIKSLLIQSTDWIYFRVFLLQAPSKICERMVLQIDFSG